ncbi:TIGR01777 family oxidoreductase [Nonomuraea sp. NPDC050328]|uniref:TIGR01777 family oxidoreductase n=1 Tax=Nonomuraea sp. NPDC050328 TaxID=3364361 RepID=UPI00378DBE1C
MVIVVTGASGLLGTALVRALTEEGHEVVRLVRRAPRDPGERTWDPTAKEPAPGLLDGAQAVVHLAGAPIGRRWSAAVKREIVRSRIDSTRLLTEAVRRTATPPETLVSASGIDFYGDTGEAVIDESTPRGTGFLAELCERWEQEARKVPARSVQLRTGLVLSRDGGALGPMLPIFKLGLGAPLGSGRQFWPWIAIDDWVGAVQHVLRTREVSGPVNVVGPDPVPNRDFTRELTAALRRPMMPIPVPRLALGLALGDFAREALLSSHRARPKKLEDSGYAFRHTRLDGALAAVL